VALLDLTVERLRSLPVLLIVTFRPEFQPPWTGQPLGEFTVYKRASADGVPPFVEELTKSVLESGLLREERDRYVLAHSHDVEVEFRAHAALQPADCLILLPQRLPAAVETSIGPAHYPAECTQSDAFLQPSLRARKGRANSNSFPGASEINADFSVFMG
jgi:hypothetical protein